MMKKIYRILLLIPFLLLGGCPGGEDKSTQERSNEAQVLTGQIRAIEKAKEVEQVLQRTAEQHNRVIDRQIE